MNRFGKSCGEADSKSRSRSIQIPAEGGGYRRPAAAILTISFIVLATVGAFALGEPDDSAGVTAPDGDCGPNLKWKVDTDGKLTITGHGEMTNLYGDKRTGYWETDITSVEFVATGGDITSIATYAFAGCTNLTSIDIPATVTYIGISAFAGSGLIGTEENPIVIPDSVETLSAYAFSECKKLSYVTIGIEIL